jgi:hypothetical protein
MSFGYTQLILFDYPTVNIIDCLNAQLTFQFLIAFGKNLNLSDREFKTMIQVVV